MKKITNRLSIFGLSILIYLMSESALVRRLIPIGHMLFEEKESQRMVYRALMMAAAGLVVGFVLGLVSA
jgi:hypothetical protein